MSSVAANLFTPNTHEGGAKREVKLSCNNPRINITTAESKIEKRRRSEVVKLFTCESARHGGKQAELEEGQRELKRQAAYNDLAKLVLSEYLEDEANAKKDYECSFTTI